MRQKLQDGGALGRVRTHSSVVILRTSEHKRANLGYLIYEQNEWHRRMTCAALLYLLRAHWSAWRQRLQPRTKAPTEGLSESITWPWQYPDIDKAVEHYTKVMGFPEAFRVRTPQGESQLVYIQVSKDTFIELQTINAQRPAGIYHFGVVVDDMAQATAKWKSRGADVREITPSSGTKAILSNIYDPNGVRMELLQLPPDSLHAQATSRWK